MSILDTFDLTGRTALVTGGYRGLGLAFATGLAEAGADLVIGARDGDASARAALELSERTGRRALGLALDVTDPASCEAAVQSAVEFGGSLEVLVNNAGACFHAPALDVTAQELRTVLDTNVGGVFEMSRAVARVMIPAGGGSIVNIGSMSGDIVNRPQLQPIYNASKAAVHHLTKSLAMEWAEHRIRVNAVAPGYVKTEMAPVDDPALRQRWIDDAPMQRYAMPEEIAPAVLYFAADASSFATGSVLTVDGGYTVV
ncbi:3-oxoacyl-ACP reductase [Brachybacterium endophyticum]|uniref:3-oxoacyl-ACP reductase n=1 Tax=Brachybacterium endophyticum TaxID=2182385 RepID=A0A2U2RNJ3_9MICO|nr:glucose 1-dehydrogenase [Brachybacterium endophyticum]PWH07438.1 3-oxoacyl-ACP reductase [Brachybacterium endophyticum]